MTFEEQFGKKFYLETFRSYYGLPFPNALLILEHLVKLGSIEEGIEYLGIDEDVVLTVFGNDAVPETVECYYLDGKDYEITELKTMECKTNQCYRLVENKELS